MKYYLNNKTSTPLSHPRPGDAGIDLRSSISFTIKPGETLTIGTNLHVALHHGTFGWVTGRSSLNAKGILCHAGVIDNGYRGEIKIVLTNLGKYNVDVEADERIAQLVVLPLAYDIPMQVEGLAELGDTDRGHAGFGSTGRR